MSRDWDLFLALAGSELPRHYGRMSASSQWSGDTLYLRRRLGSPHTPHALQLPFLGILLHPWGDIGALFPRREGAVVAGHA